MAGSDLRWSGFECSLFSGSSEVVAGGCIDSSWSRNNRRTCSASAEMNRTYINKKKKKKMDHWLLMQFHTPEREFQHPGTSNSCFYQSVSRQSSPNSPVRWFKKLRIQSWMRKSLHVNIHDQIVPAHSQTGHCRWAMCTPSSQSALLYRIQSIKHFRLYLDTALKHHQSTDLFLLCNGWRSHS